MNNLIKNNLRNLIKNKLYLVLLIGLSAILGFLFTYLYYGNVPLKEMYIEQLNSSNSEEFRVMPVLHLKEDEIKEIFKKYKVTNEDINKLSSSEIVDKYNVDTSKYLKNRISDLEIKYDFSSELLERKYIVDGEVTYYINCPLEKINKIIVTDGTKTLEKSKLLLSVQYAKSHKLEVGNSIEIGGKDFKIAGLYYQPAESLIYNSSYSSTLDSKNNAGVIMSKADYDSMVGTSESIFLGVFNKKSSGQKFTKKINEIMADKDVQYVVDSHQLQNYNTLLSNFDTSLSLMLVAFIIFVLVIILVTTLIIKNQFEHSRKNIGVLLSMGYKPVTIMISFLIIVGPIVIGLILGIILGFNMSSSFAATYLRIFNIVLPQMHFEYGLMLIILAMILVIVCLALVIQCNRLVNNNELDLIYHRSSDKVNKVTEKVKKIFRKCNFKLKIRIAFLVQKLSRLFIIFFASALALFLINFAVSIYNLTLEPINQVKKQMNYQAMVLYKKPIVNSDNQNINNTFINMSLYIKNGKTDGKTIDINKYYKISFVHNDNSMLNIVDESNKNLMSDLDKGVVVSKKFADMYNLSLGDVISIRNGDGQYLDMKIVAVNSASYDSSFYVNIKYANDFSSEMNKDSYNGEYTNNIPKSREGKTIITKEKQIEQIESLLSGSLSLIPILLFITIVLIIGLSGLIAYLNVNDNKGDIILLSILGYKDSTILKLLINVYTSALFAGCLVSCLFVDKILNIIQNMINQSTEILITLQTNLLWKIGACIIVYLIYRVSIFIMKGKIKNIDLNEVLYK